MARNRHELGNHTQTTALAPGVFFYHHIAKTAGTSWSVDIATVGGLSHCGTAHLVGPDRNAVLACTMGLECLVTITGYELAGSNGLLVLPAGTCGGSDATVAPSTADGLAGAPARDEPRQIEELTRACFVQWTRGCT